MWFDIGHELEAGSDEGVEVADAEMEEEAGAGDAGASHFLGPAPESGGEGGSSALVKLASAFMATLAVSSMASMARSAKR